jgi:hypothetical protein
MKNKLKEKKNKMRVLKPEEMFLFRGGSENPKNPDEGIILI